MKLSRIYWYVFAHILLLLTNSMPTLGVSASSPASQQGGSTKCDKSIPRAMCVNESPEATWSIKTGDTMQVIVTALTKGGLIEVFTHDMFDDLDDPGLEERRGLGKLDRLDVKEPVFVWCRIFDDENAARQAESDVREIFDFRATMIQDHMDNRADVEEIDKVIDDARLQYAMDAKKNELSLDGSERTSTKSEGFSNIRNKRDQFLERDAKLVAALEEVISTQSALRASVDGVDDLLVGAIRAQDDLVNGILGTPEEGDIVEVTKVEWESVSEAHPIDANPLFGGGKRIFPGGNEAGEAGVQEILVRAEITPPVDGATIFLKAFDRDDPWSDDPQIDTNAGGGPNGANGDDNNGAAPMLDGPGPTATKVTEFGRVEVLLTLNLNPGDNFEVVASCDFQDTQKSPLQVSQNEAPFRMTTGMLTVWRRLWVERDSMAEIKQRTVPTEPEHENYVPRGKVDTSVPNKNASQATLIIDPNEFVLLLDSTNRFVPGFLRDLQTARIYEIVSSKRMGATQVEVVVNTIKVSPASGGGVLRPFPGANIQLYDDDFKDRVVDRLLTDVLPDEALALQESKRVFRDAYVDVKAEVPGIEDLEDRDAPVKVNFLAASAEGDYLKERNDATGSREPHFWVAYLITAFQPPVVQDLDPSNEPDAPPGTTIPLGRTHAIVAGGHAFGSLTFIETIRDSNAGRKLSPTQSAFQESKVVAHEIAHQFGVDPFHDSGGIMTFQTKKGGAQDVKNSSPLLLRQIKHVRKSENGPGMREDEVVP